MAFSNATQLTRSSVRPASLPAGFHDRVKPWPPLSHVKFLGFPGVWPLPLVPIHASLDRGRQVVTSHRHGNPDGARCKVHVWDSQLSDVARSSGPQGLRAASCGPVTRSTYYYTVASAP